MEILLDTYLNSWMLKHLRKSCLFWLSRFYDPQTFKSSRDWLASPPVKTSGRSPFSINESRGRPRLSTIAMPTSSCSVALSSSVIWHACLSLRLRACRGQLCLCIIYLGCTQCGVGHDACMVFSGLQMLTVLLGYLSIVKEVLQRKNDRILEVSQCWGLKTPNEHRSFSGNSLFWIQLTAELFDKLYPIVMNYSLTRPFSGL